MGRETDGVKGWESLKSSNAGQFSFQGVAERSERILHFQFQCVSDSHKERPHCKSTSVTVSL